MSRRHKQTDAFIRSAVTCRVWSYTLVSGRRHIQVQIAASQLVESWDGLWEYPEPLPALEPGTKIIAHTVLTRGHRLYVESVQILGSIAEAAL